MQKKVGFRYQNKFVQDGTAAARATKKRGDKCFSYKKLRSIASLPKLAY
jgi:hypothetical protein